jgi:hypothetical protein
MANLQLNADALRWQDEKTLYLQAKQEQVEGSDKRSLSDTRLACKLRSQFQVHTLQEWNALFGVICNLCMGSASGTKGPAFS